MTIMESGTTLMIPSGDLWCNFGEPHIPRSVLSIVLDVGVFENILKDLRSFIDDQCWYLDRGMWHVQPYYYNS